MSVPSEARVGVVTASGGCRIGEAASVRKLWKNRQSISARRTASTSANIPASWKADSAVSDASTERSKVCRLPSPSRSQTVGPLRFISTTRRPAVKASSSSFTSGSVSEMAASVFVGRPISTEYSRSPSSAPSFSRTGLPRGRGPAQSTDSMPPSSAIRRVMVPWAAAAISSSAR